MARLQRPDDDLGWIEATIEYVIEPRLGSVLVPLPDRKWKNP